MLNAFIVDDDSFSAEATYMMFPWDEIGVNKVEKIYTTTGLVERIVSEKPDIVFIDIEMGDVSGLDIIESCNEKDVQTLFIIVIGHDNFDYAHTAVNLGAIHYLLQPISTDDVNILTKKLNRFINRSDASLSSADKQVELKEKILEYIEKNYHKKLQMQDVCSEFFISIRTLYNIFMSNYGLTFSEYLTKFRIEKAKELLITTNLSFFEISNKIGFKDQYYFNKVFKKLIGIPPSKFRSDGGGVYEAEKTED